MTSAIVVGATSPFIVIVLAVGSTGSTADYALTAPSLTEPPTTLDLSVVRPPLALPYACALPTSGRQTLHFGKRHVVSWQSRRM